MTTPDNALHERTEVSLELKALLREADYLQGLIWDSEKIVDEESAAIKAHKSLLLEVEMRIADIKRKES